MKYLPITMSSSSSTTKKWFIVLSVGFCLIHTINANPYGGYGGYAPPTIKQTAMKIEASVEIEKPGGPPKPPDYEGGTRLELGVPKAPAYPPPPSYSPPSYSPPSYPPMKPYGYGPPKKYGPPKYGPPKYGPPKYGPPKYGAPKYYKLPSTDVPYYETTSKKSPYKSSTSHKAIYAPSENNDETQYHGPTDYEQYQHSYPQEQYYNYQQDHYSNQHNDHYNYQAEPHQYSSPPTEHETFSRSVEEPQHHVSHRVIYLPADADSDQVYQAPPASPSSDYYENSQGEKYESTSVPVQDSQTTMYHKISQISSSNQPIGKDLSVYRHENRGTVINIPAASEQMMTFVKPDADGYHMMESHRYSQSAVPEIELSKITTINNPKFLNILSKQYEQPMIKPGTELEALQTQQSQSIQTTRSQFELQNFLPMPISTLSANNDNMINYPTSIEHSDQFATTEQFPISDYLNLSPSFYNNENDGYVLVPFNDLLTAADYL
uniref:Pollen-specific leucine-rich repeat extensin-like protein 2 isoform X1 n=1 Tax=Dermatophagoides pteronyssinus TaxID=6956 RepID=A0A6P6Y4Y2_DERPT|nr:pollen-specific leucine-rich repeat extensin-like protein 2 isoform X1 [Dermatophagoides pteronyssinus]